MTLLICKISVSLNQKLMIFGMSLSMPQFLTILLELLKALWLNNISSTVNICGRTFVPLRRFELRFSTSEADALSIALQGQPDNYDSTIYSSAVWFPISLSLG